MFTQARKYTLASMLGYKAFLRRTVVGTMRMDDLVELLAPRWLEVVGDFNVRGGIYTKVSATYGEPPNR